MGAEEPGRSAVRGNPRLNTDETARNKWRKVLIEGHEPLRRAHKVFRHLPGPPRCKLCHNPFGGVGGRLVGIAGFKPSRKNPNLCNRCCDTLPAGGLEVDIAVLFADLRESTALAEQVGPVEFASLLNRFYRISTGVLIAHDAIIDKLIGDEVMALFIPGITGSAYRREAAIAATELLAALAGEPSLRVGVAVDAGVAYVGNVGSDGVVDFTALGDPVNTAARLQAQAVAGELVLADHVYEEVADLLPDAEARTVSVRGRQLPIDIHVARIAPVEPEPSLN
jgi:adenylate cyclase